MMTVMHMRMSLPHVQVWGMCLSQSSLHRVSPCAHQPLQQQHVRTEGWQGALEVPPTLQQHRQVQPAAAVPRSNQRRQQQQQQQGRDPAVGVVRRVPLLLLLGVQWVVQRRSFSN